MELHGRGLQGHAFQADCLRLRVSGPGLSDGLEATVLHVSFLCRSCVEGGPVESSSQAVFEGFLGGRDLTGQLDSFRM